MAPGMWFFCVIAGWLAAALSGHPSPAPSGQRNTSGTESQPWEPGERPEVRLVNGSSRCSGTVEVQLGQSWEPLCRKFWDLNAAEAVCQVLGCGGAETVPSQPAPLSSELPRDWAARNASGTRNATRALVPTVQCRSPEWQSCEVVQQECISRGPVQVTCAENQALRLAEGGSRCAGRVEMLEHGQWGSLCDDTWDLKDADVVCKQLSCGWAIQALPGLHFAPGQGAIHRDQVNCSGAETYLWDCPGLPGHGYCGHKEDAGVVCSEHQSWRLTGGTDRCEGQVEVFFRGVWSTVCDSEWYFTEAQVLCRALGCGTVDKRPTGLPHSLSGRMFYSCEGNETTLSDCLWLFNNSNVCMQSKAARVLCSGSQRLLNLSTPEVPASMQPVTVEPSVTVKTEDWQSRELILFIASIILGILFLVSLIIIAIILLKVKGKYALPAMVNHQHLPTTTPAGVNSYQEVPITIPKEEVPKLPFQAQAPPPADPDSSSESDYEHYDFSAQPPVALTTFYNSQRHRVTDEEVQQSRFRMPALEEDPPSLGRQQQVRSHSESSTSSGEDYCNSPSSRLPPWNPQGFSSERSPLREQPPNLELAGSQGTFSGPSADDSSSTSSGEWYQNFKPPPQPISAEQFACPGSSGPQPDSTDDDDDYDDIGAG
ncbi:T-cell differentiation antigen CD6 isoform X2 [Phyllostomus hastatus]|uniref:T-cell differentiation antigen CD6 isoform X2 n=1 Tax=Phyllostomus hastatus TaxID=9423 RepID=UPI001E68101C|nr:T-cell differentiation antigen CD6 isoform X2 [Phyllostomus hastatus]